MASSKKNQNVFTVSQLVDCINDVLSEGELASIVVEGEISQFRVHQTSGHWYFAIKDEGARLDCAMWKYYNKAYLQLPREGDKVRIEGRLSVYEGSGRLSLVATSITKSGEGELLEKYKALKAKLKKEGLFDEEIKRPIPVAPRVIGIITGQGTAALKDAVTRIQTRSPYSRIIVYPAVVQGAGGVPTILEAIERANIHKKADVLLLIRGGGSIEDLWCFNDEQVARAIRESSIPIISGIGHSTDETIADLVADRRATTPTDAASQAAGDRQLLITEIDKLFNQIKHRVDRKISDAQNGVGNASYPFSSPSVMLAAFASRFEEQCKAVQSEMHRLFDKKQQSCLLSRPVNQIALQHYDRALQSAIAYLRSCQPKPVNTPVRQAVALLMTSTRRQIILNAERLGQAKKSLSRLAPDKILAMGYALVRKGGIQVMSAKEIQVGDELDLKFSDGLVKAQVKGKS